MSALTCPNCHQPFALAAVPVAASSAPVRSAPSGDLGVCPIHGRPWEYKSGVAKASGKAYAFWGCPVKDDAGFCKGRPSLSWTPPAPPAPSHPESLDDIPF